MWVGYADSYTPMKTEFAGGPVDGGTYPALIWHDIVTAYESIIGSAKEEDKGDEASTSSTTEDVPPTTTTPTAPAPVEPAAPAPTEPAPRRSLPRHRRTPRQHPPRRRPTAEPAPAPPERRPAGAAEQLDRVSSRRIARDRTRSRPRRIATGARRPA